MMEKKCNMQTVPFPSNIHQSKIEKLTILANSNPKRPYTTLLV